MESIHQILKNNWGYSQFRPMQEEIILSVIDNHDTLALLPTGGGKSICFQVPALAKEGICIVISPLIALMQDQVEQLNKRGISAVAIYSGMHARQIDILLDNCIYGKTKFLYVSPERLKTELFIERAKLMKIGLLVIDEAHCISQWGYDFRPPYLEISSFKNLFPQVPCIALTASANEEVKLDIIQKLELKKPQIFQKSFSRANLSYSVIWEENKDQKVLKMLQSVPGSSIVYARNRRKTQEIAEHLSKNGINAHFYHAGLDTKTRSQRQSDWIQGKIDCIVATNAFGMGIDKPNVRLVVHMDLPDSLEAYYQEAGRAGRDEKKAYAAVLLEEKDLIELKAQWEKSFPDADILKRTYQAICNYLQVAEGSAEFATYDFNWQELAKRFQLPSSETFYALKVLESEGLILLNEASNQSSKIKININATELYDFQIRNKKFESILKALLRLYGGNLYTDFANISEFQISQQVKMPIAEVEKSLSLLEKFEVLDYDKQNGLPKISFLTPRASIQHLPINWSNYLTKKNKSLLKIEAVEHFVRQKNSCRTRQIVAYFGENLDQNCGICDVCIQRKKESTGKAFPEGNEEERILLLNYLKNGSLSIQMIVDCLRPMAEKEVIKLVQYCLDQGEVIYTSFDEIGLTGK